MLKPVNKAMHDQMWSQVYVQARYQVWGRVFNQPDIHPGTWRYSGGAT